MLTIQDSVELDNIYQRFGYKKVKHYFIQSDKIDYSNPDKLTSSTLIHYFTYDKTLYDIIDGRLLRNVIYENRRIKKEFGIQDLINAGLVEEVE